MKGEFEFYAKQEPREIATYGIAEAAHYLSIPIATLRSWVVGRGYPTVSEKKLFKPVIILPDKRQSLLSFMNLVEAHVLNGIRKKHNVPLPKVRKAIDYLSKQLHSKHPLAEKKLKTDNIDLFTEKFGQLINLSADGQLAMREILEGYLRRIDHDPHGLAARLYPFTRTNGAGDLKAVVIDPRISFSSPDQPCCWTVCTSWPVSSSTSSCGRHSSSRMRTGFQGLACKFERRDGLRARH